MVRTHLELWFPIYLVHSVGWSGAKLDWGSFMWYWCGMKTKRPKLLGLRPFGNVVITTTTTCTTTRLVLWCCVMNKPFIGIASLSRILMVHVDSEMCLVELGGPTLDLGPANLTSVGTPKDSTILCAQNWRKDDAQDYW